MECKKCINTDSNPTITINGDGMCNVCTDYDKHFDPRSLAKEFETIKSFITGKPYDAMVACSGGKDSSAMLASVKSMGFSPLAFTFDIGFNNFTPSLKAKINTVAANIGVKHEIIDVHEYVGPVERKSFEMMAELYENEESEELAEKFKSLYKEGRNYYSTKIDKAFPFIRPCQICRKIAIRAYYAEAEKRGVRVVFIGINEWTGLSNNTYTAVRVLKPYPDKAPVYIVHFPFLVGRKIADLPSILEDIGWHRETEDHEVDTGGSACLLARSCEAKAHRMLGFHLDSARLSREITVGFLDKMKAKKAVEYGNRTPKDSVKQILVDSGVL